MPLANLIFRSVKERGLFILLRGPTYVNVIPVVCCAFHIIYMALNGLAVIDSMYHLNLK